LIEKIIIQSENQKEDPVQKVISISGNGDPISETQKRRPIAEGHLHFRKW
jgi:hypothetical protein